MTSSVKDHSLVCPVCKTGSMCLLKGSARDYISEESFTLQQCSECRSARTIVSEHLSLDTHYGEAYYNSEKGKFSPFFEKLFIWNHRRNANSLFKRFGPKKVLEVGCGRAYLLRELKKLGVEVFALESASAAEWILENDFINVVPISDEQVGNWPFPSSSFQMVIYWHVLEHISDPVTSLQQAVRILDDSGVLCVSVPNITSYQARLRLFSWFHLDVPRHLFHFSKTGLIRLLEHNDLEIQDIQPGDAIQNLYGWFQSLANMFTPNQCNGLYRLLQGGKPLGAASKFPVFIQLITSILWIPLGLLFYLIESASGHHGNITIYAQKRAAVSSEAKP